MSARSKRSGKKRAGWPQAPRPAKPGAVRFLHEVTAHHAACHAAGYELWHTVFMAGRKKPSVHVKLYRDRRLVLEWWPSRGTYLTYFGDKGVCGTMAELLAVADGVALPESLDAEFRSIVG